MKDGGALTQSELGGNITEETCKVIHGKEKFTHNKVRVHFFFSQNVSFDGEKRLGCAAADNTIICLPVSYYCPFFLWKAHPRAHEDSSFVHL